MVLILPQCVTSVRLLLKYQVHFWISKLKQVGTLAMAGTPTPVSSWMTRCRGRSLPHGPEKMPHHQGSQQNKNPTIRHWLRWPVPSTRQAFRWHSLRSWVNSGSSQTHLWAAGGNTPCTFKACLAFSFLPETSSGWQKGEMESIQL